MHRLVLASVLLLLASTGIPGAANGTSVAFRTIALEGEPAPGTEEQEGVFTTFGLPALNASGDVAFSARLATSAGDVDSSNDSGIWATSGQGDPALVAREGDETPGIQDGTFADLGFVDPHLNDSGQTAFANDVTIPSDINHTTMWRSDGIGGLDPILREGDPAPGTSGDVFLDFFGLGLNDAGDMAFQGTLRQGTGTTTFSNDMGIWAPDGAGGLELVAREGNQAPGLPSGVLIGSFRTGRMNEAGDVAFTAFLEHGAGGVTDSNDSAHFAPDGSGGVSAVAREGSQAPGAPSGAVFADLVGGGGTDLPVLNAKGEIAFATLMEQGLGGVTASNDNGLWGPDGSGGLTLVAREGDPAPGAPPGAVFEAMGFAQLNDASQMAFLALLKEGSGGVDATNSLGIWGPDGAGGLAPIVRGGVPGLPDVSFLTSGSLGLSEPHLTDDGAVGFLGFLEGAGLDGEPAAFIAKIGEAPVLLVRAGDVLEVRPGDFRTVSSFGFLRTQGVDSHKAFNDAGQFAFRAHFTDGSSGVFVASVPEPSVVLLLAMAWMWACRGRSSREPCPDLTHSIDAARETWETCGSSPSLPSLLDPRPSRVERWCREEIQT